MGRANISASTEAEKQETNCWPKVISLSIRGAEVTGTICWAGVILFWRSRFFSL